jgi:hypothetical protein
MFQNSNVTDDISGAGHVHCFGTVMWRMTLVEQDTCSETVSIPATLMTSVTLLFGKSEHVLLH